MLIPKELILEAKRKLGKKAAFIIAEDLKLKEFDEKALKALCYFHSEQTPSFVFNEKDNCYHCFACKVNYGILDHYMAFHKLTFIEAVEKLFRETEIDYSFGEKGIKTNRDYIYPKDDSVENRLDVEKYLELRKISKETLDYCDIGQDKNKNIIFKFYDTNDVLTLVKYRPARIIEKSESKMWCQTGSDTKNILFNMNRIDITEPLLIVEGETDCLSVIESGYKNCVSIPLGAKNTKWIEESYEWLEGFNKIIIWFDNDEVGTNARRDVCARLGIWRTFFIEVPNEIENDLGKKIKVKDANEILYRFGKQKVLDFIADAQELPITGVEDLASIDDFDLETAPGLYTGLKSINNIIYKFLFGSVILVTGMRGSGKSTFINQLFVCEPLQQGYDVFIFSGELGSSVVKSWIELTMAGYEKVKMKDDFVHIIDSQVRKEMREWYKNRIWIYNENSNKEENILNKAIATTRKYGVKVWVLDNLMTMDIGASNKDKYEKQKDFIVKLNRLALLYGVLIVIVTHPRKLENGAELSSDDVSGSGDMTNLAQYLLSIRRYNKKEKEGEKDSKGNYKKNKEPILQDCEVSILKNRYTGKIDNAPLYFCYSAYRFYGTHEELFKRYSWNKDVSPIPSKNSINNEQIPNFMKD